MALAIVTGAGGGIGRATARRLALDGFQVACCDLNSEAVEKTVALVKQDGCDAFGASFDLTNEGAQQDFLSKLSASPVVLVNNAAIFSVKPFNEISGDDFDRQYNVNVSATFRFTKNVLLAMPDGGRIINFTSRAAFGGRGTAHYSASKGAVISMTKSLALELAHRSICVNAIAPGAVLTDMLLSRGEAWKDMVAEQPINRVGTPEDIANAVAFFADERASFITGQVLVVDGGRSVGGAPTF